MPLPLFIHIQHTTTIIRYPGANTSMGTSGQVLALMGRGCAAGQGQEGTELSLTPAVSPETSFGPLLRFSVIWRWLHEPITRHKTAANTCDAFL